jgi:cardiolipin synthase
MHWYYLAIIIYVILLAAVLLRILFETHATTKTLAYILLCIFVPVLGILFYIVFGVNYWRKKRYSKKMQEDCRVLDHLKKIDQYNKATVNTNTVVEQHAELATMLIKDLGSPLPVRTK